ncbi:MAG: HAMP domain-containing histidine kinase [Acidimicrobiia bacterium]|nr:HAMP domain-containing histidine kinase [Acidimicrobiia bacterium]
MDSRTLSGVDRLTASRKVTVVIVSVLAYATALLVGYPWIGLVGLSVSFVPVATAAWVYGLRVGVMAGFAAVPINAGLLLLAGESHVFDLILGARGLSGQIILFGTAFVTGLLRDGSDRLRQDLERGREAQAQLEELIEAKDRFLASVSHELRTPLTSVFGFSAILAQEWPTLSGEEIEELAGAIEEQAAEAAHLIEDLLVAARADLNGLHLHLESFRLGEQAEAVTMSIPAAYDRQIRVDDDGSEVFADPVRVRQIVRNLIANAIRYGGPTVCVRVRGEHGVASISVIDDGPGIPEAEIESIFQPYYSLDDERSKPGSVGVGLSVSRQLAGLMGGDLTYRQGSEGCVFTLTLPSVDPSGAHELEVAAPARAGQM